MYGRTYLLKTAAAPTIQVGTWMYSDNDVKLIATRRDIDLDNLHNNSEWDVIETWMNETEINFSGPYTAHRYYIRLQRRVSFYTCALIIPSTLLWLLTIAVYVIPPQSGEKLALGE